VPHMEGENTSSFTSQPRHSSCRHTNPHSMQFRRHAPVCILWFSGGGHTGNNQHGLKQSEINGRVCLQPFSYCVHTTQKDIESNTPLFAPGWAHRRRTTSASLLDVCCLATLTMGARCSWDTRESKCHTDPCPVSLTHLELVFGEKVLLSPGA
jgi:hypothetical protein